MGVAFRQLPCEQEIISLGRNSHWTVARALFACRVGTPRADACTPGSMFGPAELCRDESRHGRHNCPRATSRMQGFRQLHFQQCDAEGRKICAEPPTRSGRVASEQRDAAWRIVGIHRFGFGDLSGIGHDESLE